MPFHKLCDKIFFIGEWSAPLEQYAERPEPLSCHCFVRFDPFRAVLFGGGYEDGKRNETRVFDLREKVISILRFFYFNTYMYLPALTSESWFSRIDCLWSPH